MDRKLKTLILIRHAKSSWDNLNITDFERTLNERGKKDAPVMANRLMGKGIHIDAWLCSTAVRAMETGRLMRKAFEPGAGELLVFQELYLAEPHVISSVIASAPEKAETVALIAHNPGISQYAASLTNVRIDDMPTCAMFAVSAEVGNWTLFDQAEKNFLFFDYPKSAENR